MRRRWLWRGVAAVALVAAAFLGARGAPSVKSSTAAAGKVSAVSGTMQASKSVATPSGTYRPDSQAKPPTATAAQTRMRDAAMARIARAHAARSPGRVDGPVPAAPAGSETLPAPQAANTPTLFRSAALTPSVGGLQASIVDEPSHAAMGKNIWYTGNWYAARSTTGGTTWAYVNPAANFATALGGVFCCDQDVAYDRGRDALIWLRQGIDNHPAGENVFTLDVSTNNSGSFCQYGFKPTAVNSTFANSWFDYPHMVTSNNYLWITFNMFRTSAPQIFVRHIVFKMPLDQLAACGGFSYNYFTTTSGWSPTAVDGATDVMYIGDSINPAGTFRVYRWAENSGSFTFVDRAVPAWTPTNGNGVCGVPNGANPCARADQRILSAWVARKNTGNTLGFSFNVAQGGPFPKPYTNAFLFSESAAPVYITRQAIFNTTAAWQYTAITPNARGDLGSLSMYIPNGQYPWNVYGMRDDYSPSGWQMVGAVASTGWKTVAQGGNNMGDYLRTRPFYPIQTFWSGSAYTSNSAGTVTPRYYVFGRGRENNGWLRWRAA